MIEPLQGFAKTKDVSVIMPTNLDLRLDLAKHCLSFLYLNGHQGDTVVGIWGGHDKIPAFQAFCAALSPKIKLIQQDGAVRFTARVQEMASLTTGNYIIQSGDDDFLVPPTLESLVRVLETDPSVCGVQGRMLTVFFEKDHLGFGTLPIWAAPEPDVLKRFAEHCRHTGMLFYAMLRRADFLERCIWIDETMANTKNHVWFDGMAEFFTVIRGRFVIVEQIYLLRGKNPTNTSRVFRKEASDANFPFFLLSENFSPTYKFYESQVIRLLAGAGVDVEDPETRRIILTGMLDAIRGGVYGRPDPPTPEDVHLKAILTQTPTHPLVTSMATMLLRSKVA